MTQHSPLHPTGFRLFQNIKAMLAKREDTEHEQALIRFVIVLILTIYVLISILGNQRNSSDGIRTIVIVFSSLIFSAGVFLHILSQPAVVPARRIIGMLHDNGIAAYMMYALGEYCAPFYVVLLWVTFGNGFRYGRLYLFSSALLGTAFFSVVIATTDYWKNHTTLGLGLLLGLIILPAYVSSLLKKLTDAISRAEEANRAKNQFLANMSHEMRTPLSGILGMVELLRGTPQTVQQEDYANTIYFSAQTLLYLIEDILDFSKIEAGKITVEKVDFDLHSLVKSTMAMLTPQARKKGLEISAQIPSRVPFLLRGDPLLIRQILLNLMSNAVKFTEKGEVCLRAEPLRETPKSTELRIEVSDTGIGISQEAQARIFERFTQADDSITRRYGGTGLGTTIAKQLVELMGGEIGLRSDPGRGSTFWFTLELEKQYTLLPQAAGASALGGNRILVVSSDPESAALLKKHLASWSVHAVVVDKATHAFSPLVSAANDGTPFQIAVIVEKGLDMDPCDLAGALKSVRLIRNVQLILVGREEREPDLNFVRKHGFAGALGCSIDKTLLFNTIHYAQPIEGEAAGIPSIARRYRQKKEEERRSLRILVAEDNPTNQKVIAKILERAGHQAELVTNGEEALDAMEKGRFDIVLLDLHMPVMDGLETAKVYRFTRGGGAGPPMVALTADATQESRDACEKAGFDGFLTKPIEVKRLLELVDSLVPGGKRKIAEAAGFPSRSGMPDTYSADDVIDPGTFHDLDELGADVDFLEKLIRVFLKTGEENIDRIEAAVLSRNYGLVSEIAHALKGSAAQIGAKRLADLCHRMSRIGPAVLGKEGPVLVNGLRKEFENAKRALETHAKERGRAISE